MASRKTILAALVLWGLILLGSGAEAAALREMAVLPGEAAPRKVAAPRSAAAPREATTPQEATAPRSLAAPTEAAAPRSASGLRAKSEARSYAVPFAGGGTLLTGSSGSAETTFRLPSYWEGARVKVVLDVQADGTARKESSAVTLSVNGSPFHSFHPGTEADGAMQHLEIAIPSDLLVKDGNVLRLETRLFGSTDERACKEDSKSGHWLRIAGSSRIVADYAIRPLDGSIRDFYARLTGQDNIAAGRSLVALPEDAQPAEWEAGVYALAGFSRSNPLSEEAIPLLPYNRESLQGIEYAVLIGLYDRLPQEIRAAVPENVEQGILRLVTLEGRAMLVVTSRSPELLAKAARLAANPELMNQAAANAVPVEAATDVAMPSAGFDREIRLTETGDELKGPFHREHSFYIPMPVNLALGNASKVRLSFRYGENLNFDRSLLTVKINGVPIGSKRLHKELANGDQAVFTVPRNLAVSGGFTVTAAFDLEAAFDPCSYRQEETPWAYIAPDSLLQLQTREGTELLFNHYPYPLVQGGQFASVSVVLPDERGGYVYRTVGNLFNLLGRYTSGNTGEVRFHGSSPTEEELAGRNVIAIGSFRNNAVIRTHNDKLYFRYDGEGNRFVSNEKISLEAAYGAAAGTLQLLPSPYGSGGMLVVTGAMPEAVYRASRLLAGEEARWRVYGDGVLTDRDGAIRAFRFKKTAASAPALELEDILKRQDVLGFTAVTVMVLTLVLVSLVLLIRKHAGRRRRRP